MQDLHAQRRELTTKARELHNREKGLVVESVLLIGELDRLRCDTEMGLSMEQFVQLIGLTPNVYFKRLKAARIIRAFPQVLAMLKAGETSVSQVSLLHAKLTEANAELVLDGIRNKSKREVELFLSRVTLDGRILAKEPEVELRVVLTGAELALLERAREVLAAAGHVPSSGEVLVKALGDLLERPDPMRKAARAAVRREKKQAAEHTRPASSPGTDDGDARAVLSPGTDDGDARAVLSPGTDGSTSRSASSPRTDGSPSHADSSPGADGGTSHAASSPGTDGGTSRAASSPGTNDGAVRPASSPGQRRRKVPAAVRHEVMLRDGGQCTEILADGSRCPERMMPEMDHDILACRGGKETPDNIRLKCRRHNQASAARILGPGYVGPRPRPHVPGDRPPP